MIVMMTPVILYNFSDVLPELIWKLTGLNCKTSLILPSSAVSDVVLD